MFRGRHRSSEARCGMGNTDKRGDSSTARVPPLITKTMALCPRFHELPSLGERVATAVSTLSLIACYMGKC